MKLQRNRWSLIFYSFMGKSETGKILPGKILLGKNFVPGLKKWEKILSPSWRKFCIPINRCPTAKPSLVLKKFFFSDAVPTNLANLECENISEMSIHIIKHVCRPNYQKGLPLYAIPVGQK